MKTLKDIDKQDEIHDGFETGEKTIQLSELRQVAIDLVKKLRKIEHKGTCGYEHSDDPSVAKKLYYGEYQIIENGNVYEDWEEASDISGAIKILMDLFNLTDSDIE